MPETPKRPYFCEDGLLIDPRPIGQWSIRWCPEEDFDYGGEDVYPFDGEKLVKQLLDQSGIIRKWIDLGMKVRYETAVILDHHVASPLVFMFETTNREVASRMVEEAGIVWWRSSIFEVVTDENDPGWWIFDPDSPDTASADGFENLQPKSRAHLVTRNTSFESGKSLEAILKSYGFRMFCGAHGNYDWYSSRDEISHEQIAALTSELKAAGGDAIAHFDVGPADPHDIVANPLLVPGPPEKPRIPPDRQNVSLRNWQVPPRSRRKPH